MSNLPQMHRNDFFDFFPSLFDGNEPLWGRDQMKVDISETDQAYQVKADLPGLTKEDIQVDFNNGILTIGGSHENQADVKDEAGNYIRRERSRGTFSRSFALQNVDPNAIEAAFHDGVLTVTLNKVADKSQSRIPIN
ncbi:heat shock protein, Hsp20 family [Listeria floridensis FSL S10-1187]|uniref:Heat shock protein, Hsp20 family n=1 Tax=Listeria floridensis FSL S10-1187 TaxID=1265817 RepID=A0ABP3AVC1_9LIST|nr:Hsp20/alpha crystallin family protein [Listeria floridensis]EUJ27439.1 heat shock protein, Hsp20 family [Listeria floridensis FSL S10-1187]